MRSLIPCALGSLVALAAAPVSAQERLVCFEPGTQVMTSEGFVAVRDAAEELRRRYEQEPPRQLVALSVILHDPLNDPARFRADEVLAELIRAGAPSLNAWVAVEPSGIDADCVPVRITPGCCRILDGYLLYFQPGSDTPHTDWRRGARLFVADYQPGETLYTVDGHADAVEADVALSRRRAENAALELIRVGVRWGDIRIRGYGDSRLARPTPARTAEPLNRRVVIDARRRAPERLD